MNPPPPPWKKILVPTDFSESSLKAVNEARRMQAVAGAEVVLVHVTEPAFDGLRVHTGDSSETVRAEARRAMDCLAKTCFASDAKVSTVVKEGRATEVICEQARALKVDAILVGTHGITAAKHFLLGSVAENVVRHAPCSVLVVR